MENSNNYKKYYDEFGERFLSGRQSGSLFINEYIEAPLIRKIIDEVELVPDRSAIDIGCGFGFYSRILAQANFNVTAVDVSTTMIRLAKEYCHSNRNIEFVNSAFLDDFQVKGIYQFVLGSFMLGYFSDLKPLFKKVASMINEKSVVVFSMLHPIVQSKIGRTGEGYLIDNYFENGFFKTDFLDQENLLELKRWHLEEVFDACRESRLFVDSISEPRPVENAAMPIDARAFYNRCPSVMIFKIRRSTNLSL